LVDVFAALPVFALVLFRVSGLVLTAPIYGSTVVPVRIRAALTLAATAMIFPMVGRQAFHDVSLSAAVVGGIGELMIGATIGLAVSMILMSAEVAGEMVSQQAGISLSEVINPLLDNQSSIIGQIYVVVLTLIFLLAGGHRAVMASLLDTFQVIPLLSFKPGESVVLLLAEMLTAAFIVGIRLAAPVLIALFLSGTALGFLSRTMPQLNILSVGFTLRALMTLSVAAIALGASEGLLLEAVWDGLDMIRASFGLEPSDWSGGR
jgi:flagellar biosynthetic protein FliR